MSERIAASLGAYSMSIALTLEHLRAILQAVRDPKLDREETMKIGSNDAPENVPKCR
jgi:hypothetical protein